MQGRSPDLRSRPYPVLQETADHARGELAALGLPLVPFKGRYMKPRSMEVGQVPVKILSRNPRRLGAYVLNVASLLEIPIELPRAGAALAAFTFLDSAGVLVPQYASITYKSLILVVDTTITWAGAVQPTLQLVVGRSPWPSGGGAATAVGGDAQNQTKSAAANLGPAAATSLARGIWTFGPTDIADLQWHWPYVGAELKFGGNLTAGLARLFLEMPGGAPLLVGEEMAISASSGDRGAAWWIGSQSPPQFIQDDGEVWAVAGPGGVIDCRIWEVWRDAPVPPTGDGR